MGWALYNLSAETREKIAETLFEVRSRDVDWLNGLCPFHNDDNPSFGYTGAWNHKRIVSMLATQLQERYGRNFEEKNLRRMLQFAGNFRMMKLS